MPVPLLDRLVMLFVLEIAWLLCVLQLGDTPLFAGAASSTIAVILGAGAVCLAIALLATSRAPHRATGICRVGGLVVFASGLYVSVTAASQTAGGVVLMGLGLALAVTGMTRARRSTGPTA